MTRGSSVFWYLYQVFQNNAMQ